MDRLAKSQNNKMIAGVCGGIADYFNIDPVFTRAAFLLLIPASGIGPLLYIILAIIMPDENQTERFTAHNIETNIKDIGGTFGRNLEKIGEQPRGPVAAGTVLILLGAFFLLENLGWVPLTLVWPILLIGAGLYMLRRH